MKAMVFLVVTHLGILSAAEARSYNLTVPIEFQFAQAIQLERAKPNGRLTAAIRMAPVRPYSDALESGYLEWRQRTLEVIPGGKDKFDGCLLQKPEDDSSDRIDIRGIKENGDIWSIRFIENVQNKPYEPLSASLMGARIESSSTHEQFEILNYEGERMLLTCQRACIKAGTVQDPTALFQGNTCDKNNISFATLEILGALGIRFPKNQ